MQSAERRALLRLILSMVIFGTIGIFRRSVALPSGLLAALRGLVGAACLLPLALKRGAFRKKPSRRDALLLALSGAAMGFNWILLFEAYRYTSIATATLCYYMAPIFVLLASPLVLKEQLTLRKGISAAVALLGMVMVSGVLAPQAGGTGLTGPLLGLGAAALYASVVLLNKGLSGVDLWQRTIAQLAAAGLVLIPYVLLTGEASQASFSLRDLFLTLAICLVHTGLAYALYFSSLEFVPAQTAALFSYIDPACAVFLSALFLAEPLGLWEAVGAALILGAACFSELNPQK